MPRKGKIIAPTATKLGSLPLKWHGGKQPLAQAIVGLFPARARNPNDPKAGDDGWLHYVEPYFGGGAVMFANDPKGISEVANDMDGGLANLWKVLADRGAFEEFRRVVEATPFSEKLWKELRGLADLNPDECDVSCAVAFFVCCRQSLSGRRKGFASVTRQRTRGGMNEQVSAWLSAVEGLPAVHQRLKRVLILNRPAVDVIQQQDGERSLFYLDPPYLHETRATTGEYKFEMTKADHEELLATCARIRGRFLLSGYRSPMYDAMAMVEGWRLVEFDVANHAAGGDKKRRMQECVWMNY